MRTWLLNLWDRLRNSLWFVPAVSMIGALLLAVGMVHLDSLIRIESVPGLSWVTTTGASARATLSTLAGALVTMTSVVFSITMLTLAQTSSMFGSRLLRNFLNHNVAQCTLAIFLSTSLYCFVVLKSIQESDDGTLFAPHLAAAVGLLGGLVSLAAFVIFVHHVSVSIQAQNIVRNVADELNNAIERLYPEMIGEKQTSPPLDLQDLRHSGKQQADIEATGTGYIQAINGEELLQLTKEQDLLIELYLRPGQFLSAGVPLATISGQTLPEDGFSAQINECILVGSRRTPRQDAQCAVNELVEVAIRALSPGINDPHTAIACIDYLGAALVRLAGREMPDAARRDKDGRVRLIMQSISFPDILNTAFDEIRIYGRQSTQVLTRLADALSLIARTATRPSDHEAILRQMRMIERAAQSHLDEKYDRAEVLERLDVVRRITEPSVTGVIVSAVDSGGNDHTQRTVSHTD